MQWYDLRLALRKLAEVGCFKPADVPQPKRQWAVQERWPRVDWRPMRAPGEPTAKAAATGLSTVNNAVPPA